jgi:hypothetical protein
VTLIITNFKIMKKFALLAVVAIALGITSCGKVTFGKLDGSWSLKSVNGSSSTSYNDDPTGGSNSTFTMAEGSTFWIQNTTYNDTRPSTVDTTNYTTYEMVFSKDGTYSRTVVITNDLSQGGIEMISTGTQTETGTYSIVGKDKAEDIKKGSRIFLTATSAQSNSQVTIDGVIEPSYSSSYIDDMTSNGDYGTTLYVEELKGGELTVASNSTNSSTDTDPGGTYVANYTDAATMVFAKQ